MRNTFVLSAALIATTLPNAANAAVTITFAQAGSDVVASASGTLDLTGLTYASQGSAGRFVRAQNASVGLGGSGSNSNMYIYDGFSGPTSWGTGNIVSASSGTGAFFAMGSGGRLWVTGGFSTALAVNSSATFLGQTFASLGLTAGTYVYNSGHDTITVIIPSAVAGVPEPETWMMMLFGLGAIGFALRGSKSAITTRVRFA